LAGQVLWIRGREKHVEFWWNRLSDNDRLEYEYIDIKIMLKWKGLYYSVFKKLYKILKFYTEVSDTLRSRIIVRDYSISVR
jgi:(p)ppGpp synthase/HD superfamily hydrolase